MSEHSPGPWRVLTDGTVWTDQPGAHGTSPSGRSICRVTEHRTSHGSYFDKADARLIAAAPELLEALKTLVPDIRELLDEDRRIWYRKVEAAEALIHRIEDETTSK